MNFRVKRREDPQIDLAPLIDCVFLLLLFFAVTWSVVSFPGLKLTLPGITPGSNVTITDKIEVLVSSAGDLFVQGRPVAEARLAEELKRTIQDPDSALIVLAADENVPHGRVVGLMDIFRRNGLKKVVLAARLKKEEEKR
ncbi:MAG: biopolymer transporter ExbD [Thermodesulfobacteriota bacterium]